MRSKLAKLFVAALTIFSLNATAVPTSALDLGAKGQYIITINPAAASQLIVLQAPTTGTAGIAWSYNEGALKNGMALHFYGPVSDLVPPTAPGATSTATSGSWAGSTTCSTSRATAWARWRSSRHW